MLGKALQLAAAGNAITEWPDLDTLSFVRSDAMNMSGNGYGIDISADGSKLYYSYVSLDEVYQEDLSTNWDISSHGASASSIFLPTSFVQAPLGIKIRNDGKVLYVSGIFSDTIGAFPLSTDYDITTANLTNPDTLDISSYAGSSWGFAFSATGDQVFVTDTSGDRIYKYTMSTNYDIANASYSSSSSQLPDGYPADIIFSPTGLKCYILGFGNDTLYQYNLTTPYDISQIGSTADYSVSVNSQQAGPTGFTISPNGSRLYLIGTNPRQVTQYDLG
jgi:hypothetical protein